MTGVLVMDLQFIVEDISDSQINNVISRVLDHLHYENNPRVNYEKG